MNIIEFGKTLNKEKQIELYTIFGIIPEEKLNDLQAQTEEILIKLNQDKRRTEYEATQYFESENGTTKFKILLSKEKYIMGNLIEIKDFDKKMSEIKRYITEYKDMKSKTDAQIYLMKAGNK